MTTTDLVKSIDDRLARLAAEIAVLETAREQLLNGNGAAPKPPAIRQPRPRRPARTRPTEVLPAGKLEAMLAEHKGITSTALAKLANAAPDQVLALLRELEAAGRARRTGQRRGTRWHAITDEDRIAARVAELERLSVGPGSPNRRARLQERLKLS
jgi:hypothetical protein